MPPTNLLRALDAARMIVDEVTHWLDTADGPVPGAAQLRDSAESISANIVEGYGRDAGRDRSQFLRFARGSAEETNERLRSAFASGRLGEKAYWRMHHRLVAIARMLTRLIDHSGRAGALDTPRRSRG
jgi:four helix bundle protein